MGLQPELENTLILSLNAPTWPWVTSVGKVPCLLPLSAEPASVDQQGSQGRRSGNAEICKLGATLIFLAVVCWCMYSSFCYLSTWIECQSFPWSLILRSVHSWGRFLPLSSYSSNSGLWKLKALLFVNKPLCGFHFVTLQKSMNTFQPAHYQFLYGTVWITYRALGHLCHAGRSQISRSGNQMSC